LDGLSEDAATGETEHWETAQTRSHDWRLYGRRLARVKEKPRSLEKPRSAEKGTATRYPRDRRRSSSVARKGVEHRCPRLVATEYDPDLAEEGGSSLTALSHVGRLPDLAAIVRT